MAKMSTAGKVALVGGAGLITYFVVRAVRAKEPTKQLPSVEPPLIPPAVEPTPTPGKPPGSPAPYGNACFPPSMGGQNRYDTEYWEAGGLADARARIFDHFQAFGYSTPTDRDTMNALGPDGQLGGGDDVPNNEVTRFQKDYNAVSRWGQFVSGDQMGGLWEDGKVGPCTLNGLKLIWDNLGSQEWQSIVSTAKNA